ncbi:hypothetical protein FGSG_12366 [Fusarium graminearum PH-1]|uniref:Chromosome 2, complete genome n=1 Tax=Gibberella zeae (strain ATCC MYA-4620 / CBS 123657 / FGSC 9075 / NRRL 31084 / PH-1) TaxID=229533 RepID=I1S695_GIBZE|nr:hypothetical protein FGSG_12366 [Fusarium graminearum PH-1]ESU09325.1 hypothetical protein FGSG_12366 [Fusarium graminearum PH-1]CEF78737.1 unnamed protein product [Fusarium graminearum]|eukprot:XP_011321824.1 hypothetical protein FGSG_12366 [Fusarium graminearum PH-1]
MGVPKGWRRLLTDPEALGVTNSESKPNQGRSESSCMATTGGGYKREEFLLDLSILETASTSNHFVYVTYFVPGLLTTYYLYYSTSFHSWYNLKQNIAFGRPTLRVIQTTVPVQMERYSRIYTYILAGVAFTMLVLALLIVRCCYYKRYDFDRAKEIDEELAEIRSGRSGYLPWEIQRSRVDRGDWNMISRYYRRHPELLVDED